VQSHSLRGQVSHMTEKLDFDGNGLSNSPSIAVTIVVVVAIIDITASRYCRAARGGRCAARTGAQSGGRLPGTARGVIPHSSIVAHPVKTAVLGVRIGVKPQRKVISNLAPFLPLPCHCGYCCAGYNGASLPGITACLVLRRESPCARKATTRVLCLGKTWCTLLAETCLSGSARRTPA